MKLYKEDKGYFWEIDRFMFFTETEKTALISGLQMTRELWSHIENAHEEGGMIEMLDYMINELKEEK